MLAGAGLPHPSFALGNSQPTERISSMLSITESENGGTAELQAGESLRIVLPENASTGYRWELEPIDERLLEPLASEPHYRGPAIGSGGEVAFLFRARQAGETEIALKRWRHWEGDSSIIGRFRIRLVVRPQSGKL